MAKVAHLLSNLTGGELSPRLDGRVDITKHKNGARVLENVTVLPHGGARKRSGSKFVVELKSASDPVLFRRFIYNTEQAYLLIFGPGYVWFVRDGGIITHDALTITGITKANPAVVTYTGSDTVANGDRVILRSVAGMTEVNNRQFVVANVNAGANTFELQGVNSTSYGTYTSGGTIHEIAELTTTYTADQLDELRFTQTNDVLYISHAEHPTRKITRSSHTAWTLETPNLTTGPFRTINSDTANRLTFAVGVANITGASKAASCVLTVTSHVFLVGQQVSIASVGGMTELNGNTYTITAASATTLTINVNSTGFTTYTSGGTATKAKTLFGTHEVGTTFTVSAVSATFDAEQIGGLFRLWEDGQSTGIPGPPIGTSTTIVDGQQYTNAGKVYGATNWSTAGTWINWNRVPEHDAGVVRVYNSTGLNQYFDSYFLHPLYCVVRVTAVASSTSATVQLVRYQMPKGVVDTGTNSWEEGAWSDYRGYPKTVAFHEQRLFFGGSVSEPTALWGSKSAAYEDFTDGTNDNDAIIYRIASGQADVIRWLEAGRVLTAGTSAGEFAMAASNQNEALTPSNFKVTPQTSYGTSEAPPVRINQAVLYPQRGGRASNASRKLREFSYAFDQDAFNSVDISVFAEHIFGGRNVGFDGLAYALEPDSIIYARRRDGVLASCTYERSQEVVAWHRQVLGGTDAEVLQIETIPGEYGDELWMAVERTVNATTVRYVEVIQPAFLDDDDKEDAFFVDCGATYSGSSTSSISGLWHLRGATVNVLNNGNVERAKTVSSTGVLTLAHASAGGPVHIGYRYGAIIETEDFEAGAQGGTAQGRAKRISQLHIRVLNSLGGTFGPDAETQEPIVYRTAADPMGTSVALKTALIKVPFPGGWEREARVRIEHDDPLPFHLTGVVSDMNVSG